MIAPTELFALLSDETRFRSLLLLHNKKELCVCELQHILGGIQPKISRHLALLRRSGLVLDRRKGQWVYYRINPKLPSWSQDMLTQLSAELKKREPYRSDFKKLEKLSCEQLCTSKNGC